MPEAFISVCNSASGSSLQLFDEICGILYYLRSTDTISMLWGCCTYENVPEVRKKETADAIK